jgi:hypothetical protein
MVVRTHGNLPKRMLREKYHPSPLLYKLGCGTYEYDEVKAIAR